MSQAPLAVVNEFIRLAMPDGLTVMKVIKLVLFANGWHLVIWGEPLIVGGVVATNWGLTSPILEQQLPRSNETLDAMVKDSMGVKPVVSKRFPQALDTIGTVWRIYGRFSDVELANIATGTDSLWKEVKPGLRSEGPVVQVEDATIARHYFELGRRRRAS